MAGVAVLKFGGTSLADLQRICRAASIVVERRRAGHQVVVVVSARARLTDDFIQEAKSLAPQPSPREMDMLLTSGERISAALLSIAINAAGITAVSLTGSQAGIITDDNHTNARIIEIRPYRVVRALGQGSVVVVGGFQGVSFKKEITTLGRGGSDVSASALASALDASLCEIFTDVDGVYAANPHLVPNPKRLERLSYQEMQEMAEAGAKVLHPKSVEFAKIKRTPLRVRSVMAPDGSGTLIKNLEGRIRPRVVGVVSEEKVILLTLWEAAGSGLGRLRRMIDLLEESGVKTKQFSFHLDSNRRMVGSLVLPERENYQIDSVVARLSRDFSANTHLCKEFSAVSLIGAGITDRYQYLQETLEILRRQGVTVGSLHTSSFRISLLVESSRLGEVVGRLYDHFVTAPERGAGGVPSSGGRTGHGNC
ncbi:MAG: aspartate kinase [Acidobacteriota bacterium]